jgi:hypothetical protein
VPAPNRAISVSRPGSFDGFSLDIRTLRSSTVVEGPHFRPTGFCTPRQNSTCAPSGWRVRSPIQIMCPDPATGSPVVESIRHSASSYSSSKRLMAGVEVDGCQSRGRLARHPAAAMKSSAVLDAVGDVAVLLRLLA